MREPKCSCEWFFWIKCLAKRALQCVLLENVLGILQGGRSGKPYVDKLFKSHLRLPGWQWRTFVLDSKDYGLHQSRKRAYIFGRMGSLASLCVPILHTCPTTLHDCLTTSASRRRRQVNEQLPGLMSERVHRWIKRIRQLDHKGRAGLTTCFEADRHPDKTFASIRTDDFTPCLRASGHELWLFSLGRQRVPIMNRPLGLAERCVLHGMSPIFVLSVMEAYKLKKTHTLRALGNAMSVAVVGAAVLELLHCVVTSLERSSEDSG